VKRYVAEPGSELVRDEMERATAWFMCRVGFVETMRAVGIVAGSAGARAVRREWPVIGVVEVDRQLAEHAGAMALTHGLRSLDALHLAAALVLPRDDLVLATWDARLHRAAALEGLRLLPEALG
jgi:predicted nucleic acid-binding protein